jgi:UPF0755 protein
MGRKTTSADGSAARRSRARPRRTRWRWYVHLLLALGLLIVAVLAGLGWLLMSYPSRSGPGHGRLVAIGIEPGAGLEQVAQQLATAGALAEPRWFALHARLRGAATRLRAGEVLVYDNMSPKELLKRVARGYGSAELRVVIPEGFSRFEIAQRLARFGVCASDAFLAATADQELLQELGIDGPSAEGLLFPDTYLLRDEMDPRSLVKRLVRNARRRMAPLEQQQRAGLERLHAELGWGPREVLTLASIVEKEAAVPAEQPIIARVFLNRLRDPSFTPKRLQADPTVAYGCLVQAALPACTGFDGRQITRSMLADSANPYNTYRIEGLPPGPIANPGLSALRAVLAPAEHDYFYFVAKGGGQHAFSRTLEAHAAAVEQLRTR